MAQQRATAAAALAAALLAPGAITSPAAALTDTAAVAAPAPVEVGASLSRPWLHKGQAVRLYGAIRPASSQRLLFQSSYDARTWGTMATLTTDAAGNTSMVLRPNRSAYYRTAFLGTSAWAPARSAAVRIAVYPSSRPTAAVTT